MEIQETLRQGGIEVRITNGMVSLWAGPVKSTRMAEYLRRVTGASGNPDFTTTTMEILGCIAMKQPISQAEINRYFDADKRSHVVKLLEQGLVESIAGSGGRILFVVTEKMLQRFGMTTPADLAKRIQEGERMGQIQLPMKVYETPGIIPSR